MKKVPNISPRELLEVKRKHHMGVKYAHLQKEYNISYHDVKKIVRFFSGCEFETDIVKTIANIDEENTQAPSINPQANYQKHKQYYKDYSKRRYQLYKSLYQNRVS